MNFHKLVTTVFGIGYIGKGGGTVAALIYCFIWFIAPAGSHNGYLQFFFIVLVSVLGTWSASKVDAIWGKDSNKVVIDEVVGIMITLAFIPVTITHGLFGLVLFRFFDITKPLYIRAMEGLPKGYGVMADDVLAGVYSHLILWALVQLKIVN